jgi:cytoskeletal protein CcmA (bactofilin family)
MTNRLAFLFFSMAVATGAAASIGGDGIYAGGNVDIDEPVAGNLYVAAGRITITAPISGKARIAAGRAVIKGNIEGDLRVAAGHVTLDGTVGGDVRVAAGSLELGPNARIAGKLRFRGDNLEQDPAAQVTGGITRSERRHRSWGHDSFGRSGIHLVWTAGLVLLAGLIAGAMPGAARRMEDELRVHPWIAPLFGLVALICIPIAAVLVMITIIGIPIGLLALLGYAALLIVGYVTTSVVVSGLILERFNTESAARTAWRVGAAVLAMLVIALLGRVPFVGGLVCFVALIVGVGVIVATLVNRRPPPAAA